MTQPADPTRPPRVDIALGLALTAAGGFIAQVAGALPSMPLQAYGPGFFPVLVGLGLAGCGLAMSARAWMALRASRKHGADAAGALAGAAANRPEAPQPGGHPAAMVWLIVGLAAITVGLETVGFLICLPIFMMGFLLLLGEPRGRSLLIAVGATVLVWWTFSRLLRVQIPLGWLQGLI